MKRIIYISFFLTPFVGFGQFTGGSGDGYSGLDITVNITSVENTISDAQFNLKSNFTKGESLSLSGISRVEVIDLKGQVIFKTDSEEFKIPENIQTGIYIFTIYKDKDVFRKRIYVEE